MTDLVEFLRARLDERAAKARAAMHGSDGIWTQVDPEREPGRIEDDRGEPVSYYEGAPTEAQADHMVANDPAYVLREVEAKRELIELHEPRVTADPDGKARYDDPVRECWTCNGLTEFEPLSEVHPAGEIALEPEYCPTLRLLALPYADHPDYREEWRP